MGEIIATRMQKIPMNAKIPFLGVSKRAEEKSGF